MAKKKSVWETLQCQPAVIKVSDCANMCVLLFVRVEPTDWTAVVEVRGGRQRERLLTIQTAIKLSLYSLHQTHTHTYRETHGKLMEFCFSSR